MTILIYLVATKVQLFLEIKESFIKKTPKKEPKSLSWAFSYERIQSFQSVITEKL